MSAKRIALVLLLAAPRVHAAPLPIAHDDSAWEPASVHPDVDADASTSLDDFSTARESIESWFKSPRAQGVDPHPQPDAVSQARQDYWDRHGGGPNRSDPPTGRPSDPTPSGVTPSTANTRASQPPPVRAPQPGSSSRALRVPHYPLAVAAVGVIAAIVGVCIALSRREEFPGVERAMLTPQPHASASAALRALGLNAFATLDDVERAFRQQAFDLHPDRGGDAASFKRLQRDYEAAKRFVAKTSRQRSQA